MTRLSQPASKRYTAADMAAALGLQPHPEGGFFRETYRAARLVDTPRGPRSLATCIFFLVTAGSPSRLHRLASDELWLFQGGEPLELVLLAPEGGPGQHVVLTAPQPDDGDYGYSLDPCRSRAHGATGESGAVGAATQAPVPAGWWQGARLLSDAARAAPPVGWSLVACVVSPGFDYADFELGERAVLLAARPAARDVILALT